MMEDMDTPQNIYLGQVEGVLGETAFLLHTYKNRLEMAGFEGVFGEHLVSVLAQEVFSTLNRIAIVETERSMSAEMGIRESIALAEYAEGTGCCIRCGEDYDRGPFVLFWAGECSECVEKHQEAMVMKPAKWWEFGRRYREKKLEKALQRLRDAGVFGEDDA